LAPLSNVIESLVSFPQPLVQGNRKIELSLLDELREL